MRGSMRAGPSAPAHRASSVAASGRLPSSLAQGRYCTVPRPASCARGRVREPAQAGGTHEHPTIGCGPAKQLKPAYFFSGSVFGFSVFCISVFCISVFGISVFGISVFGLNGNVLNMFFAWFCICSCICTNMFFDCSM